MALRFLLVKFLAEVGGAVLTGLSTLLGLENGVRDAPVLIYIL